MTIKTNINSSIEYKQCSKCVELKHISDFNKYGTSYQNYCKECQKEYRDNMKGNYLYFIYCNNNIKYVGSTNNYKARLSNHLNCYTRIKDYIKEDLWDRIDVLEIEEDITRQDLFVLEQLFIDNILPCWNKSAACNFDNVDYDKFDYLSELAYHYMQVFDIDSFTYIQNKAKLNRVDSNFCNKKSLYIGSNRLDLMND